MISSALARKRKEEKKKGEKRRKEEKKREKRIRKEEKLRLSSFSHRFRGHESQRRTAQRLALIFGGKLNTVAPSLPRFLPFFLPPFPCFLPLLRPPGTGG